MTLSADLTGQVAIVTAGANGLGEGCALTLSQYGAAVVIADIDDENGQRLADQIKAAGGRAAFVHTDMLKTEQILAMVETAIGQFGRIDILVNNAGGVRRRKFIDGFEKTWRKHIDLNLMSMITTTHAVVRHMIDAGRGGSIVNMSSVEGVRGAPGVAVYAACKAGMISLTRSLAAELSEYGIRINAIAPDMIGTKGILDFVPDTPEATQARERYIPLRRMGRPEEVGELVAFLSSPRGAYLNGTTTVLDGGSTAASGFTRSPSTGEWGLLHY